MLPPFARFLTPLRAALAALLTLALLLSQSVAPTTYAAWTTITIDGNGADWSGLPSFTDPPTDAGGGSGDITTLRLTSDANNVYVRWDEILTANKSQISSDGFEISVNTSGGTTTDAIGWVMVDSQGRATSYVEKPVGSTRTQVGSAQQSCNFAACTNGSPAFLEASFPRSSLGASANQIVGIDGETLASASFSSNVKDCIPGGATCSGMFSLDTSSGTVTINGGDTTASAVSCSANPGVVNVAVTCAVTVTDTTTPANVPAGSVDWSTSGVGSFGATSCTLGAGTCQVSFTPTSTGSFTVSANYTGDTGATVYKASSGQTTLVVNATPVTSTPTSTATAVPTNTNTATPLPTATATPIATATATNTATPVPIDTATPLPTDTATPLPIDTATPLPTDTATPLPTDTATPLPTDTATPVATATPTAAATDTATALPTATATPIATATATNTATPVPTDTATPLPTDTATPLPTATATPIATATATLAETVSATATPTSTGSVSGIITDSRSHQPIVGATVLAGSAWCTTDANGAYTLTGVPSGLSITVYASHPDYATTPSSYAAVTLAAGGSQLVNLTLDPRPAAIGLALSAPTGSSPAGQPLTLTAVLLPGGADPAIATGSVTFYDAFGTLGTVQVDATGAVSLTFTPTSAGTEYLTAVYAGDAHFASATSQVLEHRITSTASSGSGGGSGGSSSHSSAHAPTPAPLDAGSGSGNAGGSETVTEPAARAVAPTNLQLPLSNSSPEPASGRALLIAPPTVPVGPVVTSQAATPTTLSGPVRLESALTDPASGAQVGTLLIESANPTLASELPDGVRIDVLGDTDIPRHQTSDPDEGALGGGNAARVAPPVDLSLIARQISTGDQIPLPDGVQEQTFHVSLPVLVTPSEPDETFTWLVAVQQDGQPAGYMRYPSVLDPDTGMLVYEMPVSVLESTAVLPVVLQPAWVQSFVPDVHIWTSPFHEGQDLGAIGQVWDMYQVIAPQVADRIGILDPDTDAMVWIDAEGVGPTGSPGPAET